jgi:hypothetical protein
MQLANLIVNQPIAMRVIVNRVWKGNFGTGIVDTPSNFGFGGERPTNPELLEYLAQSFVKYGMSIKKLQREIMLSATYQLSTENNQLDFEKDSGNRLYWRANRKRMDAEQVRDSILDVAGNLDVMIDGPSQELTPDFKGRTVYGKVSRYKLDAYLQLFDFPPPNMSAEKRFTTTVPLQRLFLMNSDFVQLEAEALAKRVAAEPDNQARIRKIYSLTYGRLPTKQEIQIGLEYLHSEPAKEYDEDKNKPKDETKDKSDKAASDAASPDAATSEEAETPTDGEATPPAAEMGMGMMAGMGGHKGKTPAKPEVKYEPSVWGRYAKVLLSSTEFIFIN